MGLDMYVFRIRKPDLNYRVYSQDEIRELNLTTCTIDDFEKADAAMSQLLPYVSKIKVINEYYDVEAIIKDYNLPAKSHIGTVSSHGIRVSGKSTSGQWVSVDISTEEIECKYIISKIEDSYAWKTQDVAYWRKHYDLQERFYELIGDVENCGYYLLDVETINTLRDEYEADMSDVPLEAATDKSALFYHEWY